MSAVRSMFWLGSMMRPPLSTRSAMKLTLLGHGFPKMILALRRRQGDAAPQAGSVQRVLEQAGDRHRADAAGHRRDRPGDGERLGEGDVADDAPLAGLPYSGALDAVDADIDHRRARLEPGAADEFRPADRGDDDIGAAAQFGQIAAARMRHRDGAALAQQQQRHRLADDVRAAEDERIQPGEIAQRLAQKDDTAKWRARG